ncbi:uncharacterized protein A1O5_09904 [Cladophialophora psammophila CBS 110553]|uniref:Uncharacterized protein n=1 Tax=Cladophialophora psammophila CBS 110553 TaxID=1182543 RepID=W9WGL2_9EURO|nr:uncharacterized protein A1O5_09904 [Cladophialophora psammophila CBS 110553]EXJ67257.1 hypothetical protein A1O5_09904 [Cladophialophora psammophila CBS 110553]
MLYGGRLQFSSGLQLNFFAYSAPYRGDWIAVQDIDPKEWKRSYAAMLDWGLMHAMAFVDTVTRTLTDYPSIPVKLKYQGKEPKEYAGKEITKKFLSGLKVNDYNKTAGKPDPRAITMFSLTGLKAQLDKANSRADLGVMHKQLCTWDFLVSGIIEDAIYKDFFVRKTLRDFPRAKPPTK